MPRDKLLHSWQSHSKPGNHATLIPNFRRLHPPAEHSGEALARPCSSRCIAFSLSFSAERNRMEKIYCTADRRLDLGRRAGGDDGEEAGPGRKV